MIVDRFQRPENAEKKREVGLHITITEPKEKISVEGNPTGNPTPEVSKDDAKFKGELGELKEKQGGGENERTTEVGIKGKEELSSEAEPKTGTGALKK